MWQDLRFGIRTLAEKPGFTLVAIITLALGIGANTAIFSVINAFLLKSLPYGDAEKLAIVWENNFRGGEPQNVINLGNFFDWKEQNSVFEDMAAFFDTRANLTGDGEPEEVAAQFTTPNLFSVLGVTPVLGRSFNQEDGKPGQPRPVLISNGFWRRRYGADPQVIGRKIVLERDAYIAGVLPPGCSWHIPKGSLSGKSAELWVPWQVSEQLRLRRGRFATAVARLKPGIGLAQARAEMDTIAGRLRRQYEDFNSNWGISVVPLRTQLSGELRPALMVLFGAVGFVLLIACANVANLQLAHAATRHKEMAVRAALGANRWRIARQLLTESVLLATIGGALGLLLAWWATDALVALSPAGLLPADDVVINTPVLAFTFALSVLTGIVFGLVPSLEPARLDLNESLKESGRNVGGSTRSHRFRGTLVVVEVALSLVLLVGAGLLIKSLGRLRSVNPGFNAENVLTIHLNLPVGKYNTDQKIIQFFKQSVDRIRVLPGVHAAGAINFLPFAGPHAGTLVEIEGRPKLPPGQGLTTGICVTDAGYFSAMQIPLKRGRLYDQSEVMEMRHVVVINETFARKYFPSEEPLGKRLTIYMKDKNVPTEIIGIVADNKHTSLATEVEPMAYWPHAEQAFSFMKLAVRTSADPSSVASAARGVIRDLDDQQPIGDMSTMETLLATSISRARFSTMLLAVFAFVAVSLALVGIYGVVSYSVSQRTHEIGVRIALGAKSRDVLKLVYGRSLGLAIAGVAAGIAASLALTRLMETLLFEVSVTDAAVFFSLPLLFTLVAMLACYIPAKRAARVDPIHALRCE
jgi:putative ABC transport system permease protein